MKRTALALALASLAVAPGMAADLPSRAPPPVYVPPAPIFTWTGFYIGGNAGVTFGGRNKLYDFNGPTGYTDVNSNNASNRNDIGFTGGGQIGYNYQIGSFVLGLEADAQYLDRGKNGTNATGNLALTSTQYQVQTFSNDDGGNNFFGTARARVGYAFDRLLVYATGGLAYDFGGSNGNTTNVTFGPATGGVGGVVIAPGSIYTSLSNGDKANLGYTVGGGLEYAIFGNWSVKGEYLYTNLGSRNTTFVNTGPGAPLGASFVAKTQNEFSVARVGLNYKF